MDFQLMGRVPCVQHVLIFYNRKFCVFKADCPLPWNFITVLRIIFANASELRTNKHLRAFEDALVSPENEALVQNFVAELCQETLSQYTTTIVCFVRC